MTKFTFTTKFQSVIGVLCVTLLLIFASCVKEVVDNKSQFDAEKAELLKAKAEMKKSFKDLADATRTAGKKHFGTAHNSSRIEDQAFLDDLVNEINQKKIDINTNSPVRLTKVWNAKTESLHDYMSGNGVSEKVISYTSNLKDRMVAVSRSYEKEVNLGQLDVKAMVISLTQVLENAENDVINDPTLTQSEKLTLLAATTAGIELSAPWVEIYQDFKFNFVNKTESAFWRRIGNIVTNIVIVLVVAAIVVAAVMFTAGLVAAAGIAVATSGTMIGGAVAGVAGGSFLTIIKIIDECYGVCAFEDDGCKC